MGCWMASLGFVGGIVVVVGTELGVCFVGVVFGLVACLVCLNVACLAVACLAAVACLVLSQIVEYFACLVIRCID